ncbi:MAG: glycoside hydrolase family 2 TIM barrel-domain containing protein, partial [Terrimicrobiaceae bacterium]
KGEGTLIGKLTGPGIDEEFKVPAQWDATGGSVFLDFKNKNLPLWSEFAPNLCKLALTLQTPSGSDSKEVSCGFRKIATRGPELLLDGHRIFLRGTHEGVTFPLTGYAPMDVEGWRRIFKILKEWGLNHLRFHSYCPPEACFTAADEEGIYLQAELPLWTGDLGKPGDASRVAWIRDEGKRIFEAYGNHPSLVLFSLGNELHGKYEFMKSLLAELQQADPRRLYTSTSNRLWIVDAPEKTGEKDGPPETDDILVERAIRIDGKIQGMRGQAFFDREPNTTDDFSAILARTNKPLLTHEIGQWNVFPNLAEIPKYTGVLRPINLEAIRDDLKKNGLLAQAPNFTRVSGKFAAELYKQEIELALRSHPLAGYQLLDLHDYPGQGTAHVGFLDSFWDSKG